MMGKHASRFVAWMRDLRVPGAQESSGAALILAVSLCLFTFVRVTPADVEPACDAPVERVATEGWTREVGCNSHNRGSRALRGPARLLFGLTLDVNRADFASLQLLPRIGPSRAEAIVTSREQEPFTVLADLDRVPGIGSKTIAGLVGWASVGEAE
ncbi:MAG: hypothetical protein ACI8W3_003510 [Myxococcota bacterium]|jgi:hypothetical protein